MRWIYKAINVRSHMKRAGHGKIVVVQQHTRDVDHKPKIVGNISMSMLRPELRVDVARAWQQEMQGTYRYANYTLIAFREMLQNSMDAVRKSLRSGEIKTGQIDIIIDRVGDRYDLIVRDNGIGMSLDDIYNRFLVLSGQGGKVAGEDTGGFGVAKAVILGASKTFDWELHTRDNIMRSDMLNREVDESEHKTQFRQGTELRIKNVTHSYGDIDAIASYINSGAVDSRINVVVHEANDGKVFDSHNQDGYFEGRRSTTIRDSDQYDWGPGTTAVMKAYKTRTGGDGRLYVRLNGLTQFQDPLYEIPYDIMIDMKTTATPGTEDYPFTKGRDQFRGEADRCLDKLKRNLSSDKVSAMEDKTWKTDYYNAKKRADEQKGMAKSEAVQAQIAEVMQDIGKMRDDLVSTFGDAIDDNDDDEEIVTVDDVRKEIKMIKGVKAETGGRNTLLGSVMQAQVERKRGNTQKALEHDLEFENNFIVSRNAANYSGRFHVSSHVKPLMLWDYMAKVIAKYVGIEKDFESGFVLDDDVLGMKQTSRVLDRDGLMVEKTFILYNPDKYREYYGNPKALAKQMIATACHELAHLTFGNHNEDFSIHREHIGRRAIDIEDKIIAIAEAIMGKKKPDKEKVKACRTKQHVENKRRRIVALVSGVPKVSDAPKQLSMF